MVASVHSVDVLVRLLTLSATAYVLGVSWSLLGLMMKLDQKQRRRITNIPYSGSVVFMVGITFVMIGILGRNFSVINQPAEWYTWLILLGFIVKAVGITLVTIATRNTLNRDDDPLRVQHD